MFIKYSLITVLIIAFLFGCIWLFNHINSWLGIATFIVGLILIGNTIFNKIKTKKDA